MTEDERRMIQEVHEDRQMMKEVHEFMFKPPVEGKPSRAMELDDILSAVRAGKMGTRIMLWASGLIVAVAAVFAALKGWTK